ncbi:hypothetical protein [Streptomyces californicus]|uniref:hypothetical protein n=1 Tax=Streptomyces californicus TaxID=67351 RepID=UPI00379B0B62
MDTQQNTALTRALAEISGPLPTRGVVHITLPHTDRFTVVGNHLAQHPELSLTAIGLAVRIQSLPRGTDISIKTLAAQCREGERLIASCLRELETCGYLQRSRERQSNGRVTTRTLYCNHPAALAAHYAQARPGTLPRHGSLPHDRSVPHHRWAPAAHPEHHAVAAPAPVAVPARTESSAPAQEAAQEATQEATPDAAREAAPATDRAEVPEPAYEPPLAPEPAPAREPAREAAPEPAHVAPSARTGGVVAEPAAVPAQGPAPTPVPAQSPAPEPVPGQPDPMPRSAPLVPHPAARKPPAPPLPHPAAPTAQLTHAATALLSDLRRHAPELTLSAADIGNLAPAVAAWLEREAHPDSIRHALITDLPQPLRHPAKLLKHRLTALLPPPLPGADDLAAPAAPRPTVIPMRNCDGCERGIRSLTPTLCRDCREARAADAPATDAPAADAPAAA